MTTPEEPREQASSPSDTGWPVHAGPANDLVASEAAEPTDDLVASDSVSVDDAPVLGRNEEDAAEPAVEEEAAEPEPEPEASEAVSVEAAPVFGRHEEEVEAEEVEEAGEEAGEEPTDDLVASDAAGVEAAPVLGRNEEGVPEPAGVDAFAAADIPRPPRAVSAPVIALVLTTLLMAIANGFVWYRVHTHSAADSARRAGLEASRDAARVLFSYDYRTLDKDFSAGRALTTGAFGKQYADTTAKVVTPVATEKKAVVKAEVVTAGVVRASATSVMTIVYVNQVTTSSLAAAPKVDLSRVEMTMTKVDGHWLVSKVDAL